MAQASPLSELCSVCYIAKPKYRCPRCKIQTCSLPCYKKHQQRASCSGKRNPAAYLKKSQWATPAGIDQDYNYLKGVERTIDGASSNALARGIGTDAGAAVSKSITKGWRPDSLLQRYLAQHRITIQRAPTGMSRQKNNLTRPTKRNRIMWTVEWLDVEGLARLQHDCLESEPLATLYHPPATERRDEDRASLDGTAGMQRGSKRKRSGSVEHPSPAAPTTSSGDRLTNHVTALPDQLLDVDVVTGQGEDNVLQAGWVQPDALQLGQAELTLGDDGSAESPPVHQEARLADDPKPEQDGVLEAPEHARAGAGGSQLAEEALQGPPQFFYLLKPATTSTAKILIPLRSDASLTTCLSGQTVQEYPTIFVLPNPPDALPSEYMLEQDYDRTTREKISRTGATADAEKVSAMHADGRRDQPTQTLDAKSILDMLSRDLGV